MNKKKKDSKILLAVLFSVFLISAFFSDKNRIGIVQAEEFAPKDGVYQINGVLKHASSNQDSMGNGAIKKPMELRIKNGEATL